MQKTIRVSLASLLSLLILLSALPLGVISVSAANPYDATKMSIYNENGVDISSNPIVYVDNSNASDGIISTQVTVKIGNDAEKVEDRIISIVEAGQENIKLYRSYSSDDSATFVIVAQYVDDSGNVVHLSPGTTTVGFTTESGEVYRSLTVVVYDPAKNAKVYMNDAEVEINKTIALREKFYNYTEMKKFFSSYGPSPNVGGVSTVANHQYKLRTEFESFYGRCTDTVDYVLFDGRYDGTDTSKKPGTPKAEISEDGLLTPKSNGTITVEIKPKKTETSDRAYGKERLQPSYQLENTDDVPDTDVPFEYDCYNLSKYLVVVIVKENPAQKMKFENAPSAMQANESFQLKLSMTPSYTGEGFESGATDVVTWESSNESIATVDKKGLVTAVAKGEVTITARGENNDVFTSCKIRVLTKATALSISPSPVSTRIGVSTQLTATMSPETADEEIIWSVEDPSIATVESTATAFTNSQTAVVTGVKQGVTRIIAKAKNSGVENRINVTVSSKNASDNLDISYEKDGKIFNVVPDSTIDIYTQQSIKFDGKLTDTEGQTSDDIIVWKVTDNKDDVVTFDSTNKDITVNGVSLGTVTITATSQANPSLTKSFKVRVLKACDYIYLKDAKKDEYISSKSVNKGSSFTLLPDLIIRGNYPYQHNDVVVSWTSSDEEIATVDNNGCVTGIENGNAEIVAKTASGLTTSCYVTVFTTSAVVLGGVEQPAQGTAMPSAVISVDSQGEGSVFLSVTVFDEKNDEVREPDCFWESADTSVATVENNGEVRAVSIGQTIITVRSGSKSESCLLFVSSDLNNTAIEPLESMVYSPDAKEYTPKVVVTYRGKTLVEGDDYTVTYSDNTRVGTGTVTVIGKGKFTSETKAYFTIAPKELTSEDVEVATIPEQKCSGQELYPKPVIKCKGTELVEDKDYYLSYSSNTYPGTATVNVTGMDNYTGSLSLEFTIFCKHEDTLELYSREIDPTCTMEGLDRYMCTICGEYIDTAVDKLPHSYIATVHKPTYAKAGYTEYVCEYCGDKYTGDKKAKLEPVSISNASVKLKKTVYAYTGKEIKPAVTVTRGTKTLKKGTDYKVKYNNNKKTGVATVVITGITAYEGSITKSFKITPKKATVSSAKSTKSKQITVKWKKDKQATGYELQYSMNSKFKSGTKTVNISKNSVVSKIISSKKGKTYYFRVRAYKKAGGSKLYGAWSKVKKCKSK